MARRATRARALAITIGLAALAAGTARAQSAEDDVRAAVDATFDAMRAGDSTALRDVFQPGARMATVGEKDGAPVFHVEDSVDGFVQAVGTPHEETWDERIHDVEIRVDGRLAGVWAPYTFYLGDTLSHCGVDAFQLFRSDDGWKIVAVTDTRRKEGCPPVERP